MATTARSKLEEAKRLHQDAIAVRKEGDVESSDKLEALAKRKRRTAIRQMSRAPKRRDRGPSAAGKEFDIGA